MRKIVCLILTMLFLLIFASCRDTESQNTSGPNNSEPVLTDTPVVSDSEVTGDASEQDTAAEPEDVDVVVSQEPPSVIAGEDESVVITGVEYSQNEPDYLMVDVRLPFLNAHVPNAEEFNDMIRREFRPAASSPSIDDWVVGDGYMYNWRKYDYTVAEFDGLYCITVHSSISSAYGSFYPSKYIRTFYYNVNSGQILTRDEAMEALGYSKEEIIDAYIKTCCPARSPVEINYDTLLFYFNEHNELCFLFDLMSIYPEYISDEMFS